MSTLSIIRANRRELRNRGVTPSGLLMLEALAVEGQRRKTSGFIRLSVAALGRIAGIGRSTALRHVQRLEQIGAVMRLGPAIMLNVKGVLKWCADACKKRSAHLRRLYSKPKSQRVRTRATHSEEKYTSNQAQPEPKPIGDRLDALSWLRSNYIPPHLRENTTSSG